jgi:hypothetical protein
MSRSQGQRVLEHIGGHVLVFDPKVDRTAHPCGLCLQPLAAPLCVRVFYLTKGKGARGSPKIDQGCSVGCPMKLNFSYTVAAESSSSYPCSNVPVQCPLCPKILPAVWKTGSTFSGLTSKYNIQMHQWKATVTSGHCQTSRSSR